MGVRKRKDSDSWQAGWTNLEGRWRTRDFATKAEAVRFEAKMKAEVQSGDYTNPNAGKTKLSVVYEDWKRSESRGKPKSIASNDSLWRCLIEPTFGNRPISSITRAEVMHWATEAKSITGKKVSPSRIRQAGFLLNGILLHAVHMGLMNRVNLGRMKGLLPKLDQTQKQNTVSVEDLYRLADACGEYRLMILVAGLLGLRWAELIALLPEDFDFKNRMIHVSKSMSEVSGHFNLVTTKSGLSRKIPIPEALQKELIEKVVSTPEATPVFHSKKGTYLRSSNFTRRVFAPALQKAGIDKFKIHNLRHTAVTNLLLEGSDLLAVSKIVGHSKPTTTLNIYAHAGGSYLDVVRGTIDRKIADSELDKFSTNTDSKSA
jgi:integrase